VKLGPGEQLIKRMRYPHMLREDHAIWDKFIETSDFPIDRVWYDLHVGPGIYLDKSEPHWLHRQAAAIGRLRIDVVARVHNTYWVIELKPDADDQALGQVLCYYYHFFKEYREVGTFIPVVITDLVSSNVIEVFDHHGIVVIEVGQVAAILPD